ncbi:MAG: competence protein ComEC [Candidatus Peregrinibacteria bacterium Greene0416_62]|nr:MAG: competence protein ComEC [Candidatus Peregrinibacteria bacterium Greene0416_62]
MRPSHIASLFIGTFLFATFLLQWWQLPSYPIWIWIVLATMFLVGVGAARHWGCGEGPVSAAAESSQECRSLAGVPGETQGRAEGLWRAVGFSLLLSFVRQTKESRYRIAASISICCVAIGLSLWTVSRATQTFLKQSLPSYTSQKITLVGTVTGDPGGKPPSALYPVLVDAIEKSGALIPVTGSALVEDFGGWPEYRIGDRIRAEGILELPKSTTDFNYAHYLHLQDISTIMHRAQLQPSSHLAIQPFHRTVSRHLQSVKTWFESRITRLFPEPEAALITGLLTGERRGFSKRLLDDFSTTGLTHLVAISGTNVTIIIGILGGLLFWLPLKWRFFPQIIAIILFTLFVGASASVVRASVMGILGVLALQLGRIRDTRLAILWTAFAMTLWKPEQLWWDAGFQLSFAAVIGVTEIGPRLQKAFSKIPESLGLRDSLAMTLAAQITTLPVSVLTFGQVSLIAPLSNILAAPMVPIAMLLGFCGTMISLVYFPLGQLVAFGGYGAAEWITETARILAKVPYAAVGL